MGMLALLKVLVSGMVDDAAKHSGNSVAPKTVQPTQVGP